MSKQQILLFGIVFVLPWQFVTACGSEEPASQEKSDPSRFESALETSFPKNPNMVIISLDTTRADRIGAYGYGLARTAAIDGLAKEGVRCGNAVSAVPITLPSHTTIMTGLYPPTHGVRDNGAYALGEDTVTAAEILKSHGYDTAAFVSALVLNRRYNLDQGFDTYNDDLWEEDQPAMFMIRDRPAQKTAALAVEWLDKQSRQEDRKPFFMWAHFFDPHQPWESKAPKQWMMPTGYDAEIAQADIGVGMIVEKLKTLGVLDETIVVVVGDHGESLGEHGEETHALFIYDATLRVPLIFRYPPSLPKGSVYSAPVETADILPTMLRLAGIRLEHDVQGIDLTEALRTGVEKKKKNQYCESLLSEVGFGMAPLYGLRNDNYKYIRAPRPELYDLKADPRELTNLYEQKIDLAKEMDSQLTLVLEKSTGIAKSVAKNPMDGETVEMLMALGYLVPESQRKDMGGIDPKDGIVIHNALQKVRDLARRERWMEAEKESRKILETTPNNVSARNVLGLTLIKQDKMEDARKEYTASLATDPRQHRVYSSLALIDIKDGKLAEASKLLEKSLELVPDYVESMVQLGFIEKSRGNAAESEKWYKKALEIDPTYPDTYNRYGDFFFLEKKYDEALDYYKKALEKIPNRFQVIVQAGVCAKRLDRTVEAIGYFEKAAELRNDSWIPVYNLACMRALNNDSSEALSLLRHVVEMAPMAPRLYQGLRTDEDLSSLRKSQEFESLLNLTEEARNKAKAKKGL